MNELTLFIRYEKTHQEWLLRVHGKSSSNADVYGSITTGSSPQWLQGTQAPLQLSPLQQTDVPATIFPQSFLVITYLHPRYKHYDDGCKID